ncbi:transcription factor HES-5-like [Polypterus senegalus]
MAPAITSLRAPLEDKNICSKLRKPLVEKMRRDRMNKSIEQLGRLLTSEGQIQKSDSRMEKADILELAVSYLNESRTILASRRRMEEEGYVQCAREIVRFLCRDEVTTESHRKLLDHFENTRRYPETSQKNLPEEEIPEKERVAQSNIHLWRPW